VSSPFKILLVGQSDDSVAALRDSLTCDDLEVSATAGLGPAALTWAQTTLPDVVVVVIDDESMARPVSVVQALAQGEPAWTVVVLAPRFERELVRQAMLAGARDVLMRTSGPAELRQALVTARRADLTGRTTTGQLAPAAAGTIITSVGVKGGIGKTNLSVNLAIALALETERSVALVDLDLPFGDLAMLLNLRPGGSVPSVLNNPAILADPELMQQQLCEGPAGIHVLPAPVSARAPSIDTAQIAPLLTRLGSLYDFVVIDTPGGFGEFTAAALDVSTQVLMVTTPEAPTLRRTELGLRQLAEWSYPMTRLRVVLNRATLRTGIDSEAAAGLLSLPITDCIPDEPAVLRAAADGQPIVVGQPKTPIAAAFRNIARSIAGLPAPTRRPFWAPLRVWPAAALAQG
jgi:pilus assembly protein CpaE